MSQLKVDHTFALSGTPIENRSMRFGRFSKSSCQDLGDRKQFRRLKHDAISRMIQPFVMRRRKEDVLLELPESLNDSV